MQYSLSRGSGDGHHCITTESHVRCDSSSDIDVITVEQVGRVNFIKNSMLCEWLI